MPLRTKNNLDISLNIKASINKLNNSRDLCYFELDMHECERRAKIRANKIER